MLKALFKGGVPWAWLSVSPIEEGHKRTSSGQSTGLQHLQCLQQWNYTANVNRVLPHIKPAHFLRLNSQSAVGIHSLTHSFVLFFYPQLYLECLLKIRCHVQHCGYSVRPTEVEFQASDSNSERLVIKILWLLKDLELKIKEGVCLIFQP